MAHVEEVERKQFGGVVITISDDDNGKVCIYMDDEQTEFLADILQLAYQSDVPFVLRSTK